MWFLRLAKSLHKLFRSQFLFGIKIKSTYENVLQNTKILELSVKRRSQSPIYVLGPRQKWVNLPPTFLNFLSIFWLMITYYMNIQKRYFPRVFCQNLSEFPYFSLEILFFQPLLSWKMKLERLNFIPERSEGIKESRKFHFTTK